MNVLRVVPLLVVACCIVWLSAGGMYPAIIQLFFVPLASVAFVVSSAAYMKPLRKPSRTGWGLALNVLSLLAIISALTMHWPLRWSFRASRPAFVALAKQLQAGQTVKTPLTVGLFTVNVAEMRAGTACFNLDEGSRRGDFGEPEMFVFHKGRASASGHNSGLIVLDDDWYYYASL